MRRDLAADYLSKLPADQRAELARVNGPGLTALRGYLASGEAVAFLGAGVSAPLYPLWDGLIGELVNAAAARLGEREEVTLRALAQQNPEEVMEIVRQQLGVASYREVLRGVLRARVDPASGRSWTLVQELVCRCSFKAVVTTNYDPGIVDARIRVRPGVSATGFITWEDELGLDRWRTGDVFGEAELPVLFAHGQHNRPDSVVLATTEYRRAYAGKLPQVLARLADGHLVWIGFSFADQRIAAILREIADRTGTRANPGGAPRHVTLLAWDPAAEGNDPQVLARRAEIAYGAQAVLYPAPGGDHSALGLLLAAFTDDRFPASADLPARAARPPTAQTGGGRAEVVVRWVPAAEPVEHFTGRAEELARLNRWAADPQVALVGVTAWGGAGKTALVTQWIQEGGGASRRAGVRGVFGWSFYADPSAEHWATALLDWAQQDLGIKAANTGWAPAAVLSLLQAVPLLLVLDGLEVMQEGPAGAGFGRLLDGTLRQVLAGVCQRDHGGLLVLTSRFPFADLEGFDGSTARMLDVPPFTPAEGSELLGAAGGSWLAEDERRDLVRAVDGHALATGVLAGLLATGPPASDLAELRAELAAAARTDARVGKVLQFYAGKLREPDRYLLAAVSLFARPIPAPAVLAVAEHDAFAGRLAGWTSAMVEAAVRDQLGGLAAWHPDGSISAHPLVRDTFRPLVIDAARAAVETALAGMPTGQVTSRADGLRVGDAIELLLDAGQWRPADDMYWNRTSRGDVWKHLPAARLGQRVATAFVATPGRRDACTTHLGSQRLAFYLNEAGLFAMPAGDLATARHFISMAVRHDRDSGDLRQLAIVLHNMAECLGYLGEIGPARNAAAEALACAQKTGDPLLIHTAHGRLAWLADLNGDTAEAEQHFAAAAQILDTSWSQLAAQQAEWLARTGRPGPARALALFNQAVCRGEGWDEDVARSDRQLGRQALAAGNRSLAGGHLWAAEWCFRAGDYLIELAYTLVDLARLARAEGNLDAAERHVTEAITIAGPRGIVAAQSAALAARAQIRADQAAATADSNLVFEGRDAADAALRQATRHHLAWRELDALHAHTALDQAEHTDRGWAAKANALHARLVPPGLDPHPLPTVERLTAVQEPSEREPGRRDGTYGKVGRNVPCPCGSGRKYKRCHGDPRRLPAS
jgi:tetratricopeptide (TPR) repeat protein